MFVAIFLIVTPIAIGSSFLALFTLQPEEEEKHQVYAASLSDHGAHSGVQVYASLPSEIPSISGEVLSADARPEILRQYMQPFDSELIPYVDFLVATADKYNLDYRLLTAIARKESGLCNVIPEDSHNCWGYGIHSAGTLRFDSYEEAIEEVSRGLKEDYAGRGLITVEEIMSRWIPHSPDGIWAEEVEYYIEEME